MAHRTTHNHRHRHRQGIEVPDPDPDSIPSLQMDPTVEKLTTKSKTTHPKTAKTSAEGTNADSLKSSSKTRHFYYLANTQFSRLNLDNYRTFTSKKKCSNPPGPGVDIRLQAKALTVSADSDSKFMLSKPSKQQQPQKTSLARNEKERRAIKESCKEMIKKPAKSGSLGSKKMEVYEEELYGGKKVTMVKDKDGKDLGCNDDVKRVSVPVRERRRSICGSQVELSDVMASCGVKVVSVDMPPFMQIHAFDCARKTYDSLEKFTAKTLALTLKKEFDGVYGPAWHCIVGTSFGSFVTHSVGGFLYFSMDQKLYILLFKTTVQRAD